MWPLQTSSSACRNVAWLGRVSFRTVKRRCRKLVIQRLSFWFFFEDWWNSGFAFSMLLADKPNFCAEKHAKRIFVWSVGKSYCGCFCFYGLMLFVILLPKDKTVQIAISGGWHLLGLYPEMLLVHVLQVGNSRATQTWVRGYTEKFPVKKLKCSCGSSHKYQVAKGCFNLQTIYYLKLRKTEVNLSN